MKKTSWATRKSGFTMMEILMVIAILAILSSVILTSLVRAKRERELQSAAREVVGLIKEAQNNALTGKKDNEAHYVCTASITVVDPKTITPGYSYHNFGDKCEDAGALHDYSYPSYKLKEGITIAPIATGGDVSVEFVVPHASLSSNKKFTLTKEGTKYTVCVYKYGSIQEFEGDYTCP